MPDAIYTGVSESHLGALQPYGITVPSGAATTAFTPTSIAGLVTWIDFSDATTLWQDTGRTSAIVADAAIKGVTDKSGNAIHLSEATNGPTYKTAIQNSKSVARFDGTNDILTSASITQAQPATVFVAGKMTSVTLSRRFLDANTGRWILGPSLATNKYQYYAGGSVISSTETTADNSWHAHAVLFNGASSTYRIDGTALTMGNPGTGSLSTTFFLGRDNAAQFEALDYGELLIYNSALSVGDQATVNTYLKAKWGTP